jgi:dihydropyrimidinase
VEGALAKEKVLEMNMFIFENANIVTSRGVFLADMMVGEGKILAIGSGKFWTTPAQRVDLGGKLLLAGAVDAHCHVKLDTGAYETVDDWRVGSREAALGGITTLIDFTASREGEALLDSHAARKAEAAESIVDYQFHVTIINDAPQTLEQMGELASHGCSSIKLYTTYRPLYYCDDRELYRVLKRAAQCGLLALVHCENDAMVSEQTAELVNSGRTKFAYHPHARPVNAELEAAHRVLKLAEETGASVVIAHNSCGETPYLVQDARRRGVAAYCETAPQYLWIDESCYESDESWRYILQPPLRPKAEVERLRCALNEGLIDILITDHCAYSKAQKLASPHFNQTPGGLPGLQTFLQTSAALPGMTWPKLTRLVSENPAKIYGLWPQKGSIQVGADADFVVISDQNVEIREEKLYDVAGYSPFHRMLGRGRIEAVYRRGECLVEDGKLREAKSLGAYVHAQSGKNYG